VSDAAALDALLDELAADNVVVAADVAGSEEAVLVVGLTPAGCAVTRRRDGDYEQLIGDSAAAGETELPLGDQPTPTPDRWLVTRAEAIRTLGRYLVDSNFPDGQVRERL
jgi:hypothetical protein